MRKAVIVGMLGLASVAAFAEEGNRFYLTPSFGQSSYGFEESDGDEVTALILDELGLDVIDGDSSLDDSGTAWSIGGGWKFSRYFAAEMAYVDLGKNEYRAEGTVSGPGVGILDSTSGLEFSSKGFAAGLVGIVPIGEKFELHAKAGMLFAKTELDFDLTFDEDSASGSVDSSSSDPFFGAGAAFHFTDRIGLTLDYLLYDGVGDEEETGEADIDSLTLGVVFSF